MMQRLLSRQPVTTHLSSGRVIVLADEPVGAIDLEEATAGATEEQVECRGGGGGREGIVIRQAEHRCAE